jgi:hypothetical protein
MNASSLPDDAGRKRPGRGGAFKKQKQKPCSSPAGLPRRRSLGDLAKYEASFTSVEKILEICRLKQQPLFVAGQVIVCQTLMKERKWRPTDLAFFSGNEIGQTALVLKAGCFPPTLFWLNVCHAFHLTMAEFCQKVQDWCTDETSRS